jgi:hypothetical protein
VRGRNFRLRDLAAQEAKLDKCAFSFLINAQSFILSYFQI